MKGELLSALSVSPDGHYLATGNLEGTVCILRADSLDVIYSAASAHETFVTDLEFADCTFGAKILTQTENAQCTVFSVSADRKILLHQADFRCKYLRVFFISGMIFLIAGTVFFPFFLH
jgi:WD40 repeat protein